MSLFSALDTSVSGLSAQSAAFGNISDNVANSQTVGFKGVDTSFIDYLTTSTSAGERAGRGGDAARLHEHRPGNDLAEQRSAGARHRRSGLLRRLGGRRRSSAAPHRRASTRRPSTPGPATSSSTRTAIWSTAPAIILQGWTRRSEDRRRQSVDPGADPDQPGVGQSGSHLQCRAAPPTCRPPAAPPRSPRRCRLRLRSATSTRSRSPGRRPAAIVVARPQFARRRRQHDRQRDGEFRCQRRAVRNHRLADRAERRRDRLRAMPPMRPASLTFTADFGSGPADDQRSAWAVSVRPTA